MSRVVSADQTAPGKSGTIITPSDSTVLQTFRAIWVGGAGNINMRTADGTTVVFTNVPVGMFPMQGDMVLSTSTTATGLVAIY